jgi:hypothetical protein
MPLDFSHLLHVVGESVGMNDRSQYLKETFDVLLALLAILENLWGEWAG